MADEILEEIWRVREQLLKQYGGLHGLVKHLQAMDRARARKTKQRAAKRQLANGRKRRTRPVQSLRRLAIKTS
jgi:hypothetical protein